MDQPNDIDTAGAWGSDVAAQMLRRLDSPYIALNPGASYRGLHDSLVNHLGNSEPQMLLCLHEESAVSLAQGYAKVTGKPLLVGLHSNVGLMHATMSIFNAWCDRMPMIMLGATGPQDARCLGEEQRCPGSSVVHEEIRRCRSTVAANGLP